MHKSRHKQLHFIKINISKNKDNNTTLQII